METRKVIGTIEEYGIAVDDGDYYYIEHSVGKFWNTHIQKVIRDVMTGGSGANKIARAETMGWMYFAKPITSMLTPRGGAARTEPVSFEQTDHGHSVYNLVTRSLLLTDCNMKELALLAIDIPPMVSDMSVLARAIQACKTQNTRSVYYLHGVLRREYQTTQGKIREILQQAESTESAGWAIPVNFEPMDFVERRMLDKEWQDMQNSIEITKHLNEL